MLRRPSSRYTFGMTDPPERLRTYRAKRDFAVTPEPAGAEAGAGRRAGSSSSATGPGGCTTTSGWRSTACWPAGRCPKGPTLDPKARQLAVHVEDHPIEYFDFEGVIPQGRVRRRRRHRVGLGDVARPPATDDPAAADRARASCTSTSRARSWPAASCWSAATEGAGDGKEQWLLLHKNDEHARPGWDPEDHPRSVKSGRTNDEVAAAPDGAVAERPCRPPRPPIRLGAAPPAGTRPPTTSSPPSTRCGAGGHVERRRAASCKLTNLDKVLFPGPATARRRSPSATSSATTPQVAPCMLPYLVRTGPVNLNRYPRRGRPARLLAQGGAEPRARVADAAGTTTRPTRARPSATSWSTASRRWRGWPTTARSSCTRGRRGSPTCTSRPGR